MGIQLKQDGVNTCGFFSLLYTQ